MILHTEYVYFFTIRRNYMCVLVEELRNLYVLPRDIQSVQYYARPFAIL